MTETTQATERVHVTRSRAKPGGTAAEADGTIPFRRARKPPWLKVPAPGGPTYRRLKAEIGSEGLHTVCEEANCPNVGECWERGTATFMILGDVCTRRCGFCNVKTGVPTWNDPLEPLRVANQVKRMGLRHAVVTSVDRDDLPDYGAGAFVGTIRSIRMMAPGCKVEVLTPDFRGQEMPLAKVIHERPDVFNHNVETVPRLYPKARRGSRFLRSARVLRLAKEMGGDGVVTKSGLMVGLGEEFDEMLETLQILRDHRVQVLTVGQYLRPTENHLPVVRYWHPEEFEALEKAAYEMGFESVASGPLVRSSYHADQLLEHPPVYTRGRRSSPEELPMGVEWYEMQGIEVRDTDRGGRVTYHGPGQLVAYPIVSLKPYGDDVHEYVRRLERVAISALADHGVSGADDRGTDRHLGAASARSARSASTSAAASPPTGWRSTSTTTCSPSSGSCPAGSRAAGSPR